MMPRPHTGDNVRELFLSVVDGWSIPHDKIGTIITDSGSNMVKAFRQDFFDNLVDKDNEIDDEPDEDDEDQRRFDRVKRSLIKYHVHHIKMYYKS